MDEWLQKVEAMKGRRTARRAGKPAPKGYSTLPRQNTSSSTSRTTASNKTTTRTPPRPVQKSYNTNTKATTKKYTPSTTTTTTSSTKKYTPSTTTTTKTTTKKYTPTSTTTTSSTKKYTPSTTTPSTKKYTPSTTTSSTKKYTPTSTTTKTTTKKYTPTSTTVSTVSSSTKPTTSKTPSFSNRSINNSQERKLADLQRRLERAEKEAADAKAELADIKRRRESAKLKLQQKKKARASQMFARPPTRTPVSSTRPGGAAMSRTSTRQSTRGPAVTPGAFASKITAVLGQMAKLEAAIVEAENGRARAENELIEYSQEKKQTEKYINDLNVKLEKAIGDINRLVSLASSNPTLKRALLDLKTNLNTCKKLADNADVSPNVSMSGGVRVSVRSRGMSVPTAPSAPVAPAIRTTPAGGDPRMMSKDVESSGGSLLAQIRAGKDLKKIDLDQLKRDRQARSRKSMALVSSLTETLRLAINTRHADMSGDDYDDCDPDEDDVWDDTDIDGYY